jgi:sterol desaturase/sphingolipid hydroxylase (fatty acid hydroxylase superfamily)
MDLPVLLKHIMRGYALDIFRYIVFAGGAYLIFYVWKREKYSHIKIQSRFPGREHMGREVIYSLLSFFIFASAGALIFTLVRHGHTRVYTDIHAHSLWYLAFTVFVFIVAHDTYFYWTHRFMHWPKIYRYVHRVHHLSTNPTPWAAFAFHPLEAIVEVGILPIMVFLIPLHPLAIFLWVIYMTFLNVMGHLGYEIFPSGFTSKAATAWHNTSVHHNMHHKYVRCNYGLYFNVWDRIMGTNHDRYHEEFENVKKMPAARTL